MCGRISLFAELGDLASQFRFALTPVVDGYQPSWNIAPTAQILTVTADTGERAAGLMRWGFTFGGQARGGSSSRPLFNARAGTVAERPAFRAAFAQRRCLIPVNRFYECQSGGGGKLPCGYTGRTSVPSRWPASTTRRRAGRSRVGRHQSAQLADGAHPPPDAGASGRWRLRRLAGPGCRRRNPPRAAATGGVAGNDHAAGLQRGEPGRQRWPAADSPGYRRHTAAAVSGRRNPKQWNADHHDGLRRHRKRAPAGESYGQLAAAP